MPKGLPCTQASLSNENLRAKEDGKEETGEAHFALLLSLSHGPLLLVTSHSGFALPSSPSPLRLKKSASCGEKWLEYEKFLKWSRIFAFFLFYFFSLAFAYFFFRP